MRAVAIVLAGGTGSRVGGTTPKQFLVLGGKTVLEHALAPFEACARIDDVVVVAADIEQTRALVGGFSKVRAVVPGGARRSDSSMAGLAAVAALGDEADVLIHDTARPFVSEALIVACLDALGAFNAVCPVIEPADTVVKVEGARIASVPDRASMRAVQTPQGFRLSTIRQAYELAAADPSFEATDDCGVVHRYLPDEPIAVIEGSPDNIKLTYAADVETAERLLLRPSDD